MAKVTNSQDPLLEIRNLTVLFATSADLIKRKTIKAVDNVSFSINRGESLGIVGESGSGKTTLARAIVRLVRPKEGSIFFDGKDVLKSVSTKAYTRRVQIIFQDPYESLNPRSLVRDTVEEPMIVHGLIKDKKERRDRMLKLLELAGLNSATVAMKYPHELSGGERQRVSLARSLALSPELLIADEPVSMLDVSVRIGIINLMLDLKRAFNLSYIFITHDLAVARYFCDKIGVMYRGRLVEIAETERLLQRPKHPYTKLLLDSVPGREQSVAVTKEAVQDPGSAVQLEIKGCKYNPRCPYARDLCRETEPQLVESDPGHLVACHFPLD